MSIEIERVKILQPISCRKCAKTLTENDVRLRGGDIVEMVCSGCHDTVMMVVLLEDTEETEGW